MYHGSESVDVNDTLKSEQEPERMRAGLRDYMLPCSQRVLSTFSMIPPSQTTSGRRGDAT